MAIQTRYAGDSNGINNVDAQYSGYGYIVASGLTKNPIAVAITVAGSGATANLALETGVGGAVETILRSLEIDGTVTAYQVNPSQLSVLLEATGAGGANGDTYQGAAPVTGAAIASALATRLQALGSGGNIGLGSNVWAASTSVTNVGLKLATS